MKGCGRRKALNITVTAAVNFVCALKHDTDTKLLNVLMCNVGNNVKSFSFVVAASAKVPGLSLSHRITDLVPRCQSGCIISFLNTFVGSVTYQRKSNWFTGKTAFSFCWAFPDCKPAFVVEGSTLSLSLKLKNIPADNWVFVSAAVCVFHRWKYASSEMIVAFRWSRILLLRQHHAFSCTVSVNSKLSGTWSPEITKHVAVFTTKWLTQQVQHD